MSYTPTYHRRSIRLKGYDYAQPGAYFVTICTQNRECLFGEVVDGAMRLNALGEIVQRTWCDLPNHVDGVVLDALVVMPNHVHGIIMIVGAGSKPAPPEFASTEPVPTTPAPPEFAPSSTSAKRQGLPEIVRQFKTFSARRIAALRCTGMCVGVPHGSTNIRLIGVLQT